MESNDDKNLEAINASVGRLVWVRRRNGSWWPGQTLLHEEVPQNSPKVGTPIKLLGRDDVNVDWYILEKSKMVKAFRCGDYDTCIDKAKVAAAAASSSNKKPVKCSRREEAINNALEIENAHLSIADHLCSEEDSKREDNEDSDAGEQLQSSMSSQEMIGDSKVMSKRTPNDSEDDDGTEGIKRMRGLEDIGKEGILLEHKQEMGSVFDVSLNGPLSNGNKVCSPLLLKRKRSQVRIANECSKRKNRRKQLTKVLESTAMVSVPVTCDQLDCQGLYDSKVLGIESVESLKSVSVVINNNSDSTGISCENASDIVVGASHNNNKTKDSEISSLSVSAEDDSSDGLFDVPLIGEDKHSAGFSAACRISSSKRALVFGRMRRRDRNGYAGTSPQDTQPLNCNLNGIEKSTSEWQLKGKRNSRQMSKKQEARRNVYGEEANNNNNSCLPHPVLYEVKVEVKANYKKPHNVPLVSRMSALSGKAIVGHPLTVEILEEGYCDGLVVVKTKSLKLKKKKKSSSLSKKTRRLSTLTSYKLMERSKKKRTEKVKETVVACIPLKVVFSRINEVLKGSTRQMQQHRALPSTAKT